ncbi:hypothetical protein [Antarcticirhabdus aurantiaca]|uniref:Uncharacterized protein n=1 Tax=Antarcticirhabdus aurantiaca TaxID=2606717 RepID=A0ACD4NV01_9HYPH|nr:hypothetical protein [Antarcticirhabdus aurantiaca]WAJ30796.1 hypothetical protein OXU80_11585 [Jeongeuplla avenae]
MAVTTEEMSRRRRFAPGHAAGLALSAWMVAAPAFAQEPPAAQVPPPASPTATEPAAVAPPQGAGENAGPEIVLQLNNLQPIQPSGCRFTFLATNNRDTPIERLGVELVVFDAQRQVDQFLVLEFTRLAAKKTKVSQFDLAERSCSDVSQLLVNDVVNCGIEEGATPTCAERVKLDNLTDIQLAY